MKTSVTTVTEKSISEPQLARCLGKMERSMWFFEQSSAANICVGCDVNGTFTDEGLRQAIDWCQIRYPMLRTVVRQKKKQLYFACYKENESPPISIDISEGKCDQEDRIVEQVLSERLAGGTGLLVSVKLVRIEEDRSFLCVYFSHLIGDGFSGVLLMRDLLTVLGHHESGEEIPKVESLEFPPTVEEGIPEQYSGFKGFKKFLSFQKIFGAKVKELGGKPSPLRLKKEIPHAGRKTNIRSLSFSKEETGALMKRSKEEGLTFYALLSAVTLDAMQPFLEPDKKSKSTSSRVISFASPVDLRPFLSISAKKQFGFYASSMNHLYRLEERNDMLSLAKKIQADLKSSLFRVKSHLYLTPYVAKFLALKWLFPVSDKGVKRTAKLTEKMFQTCAANLTFINNPPVAPEIGNLKIEHARGHIAPSVMGTAFYSAVLYNEVLTLYLNYNDGQFCDEDANKLNKRIEENIRLLIQGVGK